jgi:uncharacterized membrane protein
MDTQQVSKTFFKGLIAIIPLALTLYLLVWLAGAAEFALGNIFKLFFPDRWYFKGLGFVLGLVVVYFFGKFLNSRFFQRVFNAFEDLVVQVPVVKSIYTAIRDFTALFSSEQKGKFEQVVLVDVPYGGQQIGFITVSHPDDIQPFMPDNTIAVFLPFSYQMGGNTIILPKDSVTEIDMTIEDALRFIATAGVVGNIPLKNNEGL